MTTTMMSTEFVVMTSNAKMPTSVRSRYINVAVCEVERGVYPKMISERARGMVRIVKQWAPAHVGTTERSASAHAIAEANKLCAELNSGMAPIQPER
jgi:hypothetical protein